MAGIRVQAVQSGISLTLGTAMTVVQVVAAANHRVLMHGFELTFNSTDSTKAPQLVQVLVQTTAGTMTALTLAKRNSSDSETLQTTARHTSTADPTDSTVLKNYMVSPLGGIVQSFRFDSPIPIVGGTRLGIKVTPTANCTCAVSVDLEE